MAIKYTPTQATIETGSTQYNVQPNLTTARAFEKLERGILSGMKYKEQVEEENFRNKQTALRNTMTTFQEEYASASYAERQMMARELDNLMAVSDGRDNRWNRELDRMGNEFASRVRVQLAEEGERRAAEAARVERARNRASIQLNALELQRVLIENPDPEAQNAATQEFYANNVAPYENSEDADGLELYAEGLGLYNRFNAGVVENRRSLANSELTADTLTAVQAGFAANGGMTTEQMAEARAPIEARSDYEQNRAALNGIFAEAVMNTTMAQHSGPDYTPTQESLEVLKAQIEDIRAFDPHVEGSAQFRQLQNFATSIENTLNQQDLTNLNANLQNGTVSPAAFEDEANSLVDRGLISREQADNLIYQKGEYRAETVKRDTIMPMVQSNDVESLTALIDSGEVSRETITSAIKDNAELTFSRLVESGYSEMEAAQYVLSDFAQYKEAGIAPTRLGAIDNIFALPRSGAVMSTEQLNAFLATEQMAREVGYAGPNQSRVATDALILRSYVQMGVPNPAETYFTSLTSPTSVSNKEIDDTLSDILSEDSGWFTDGLNPTNVALLRTYLRPVVRSMRRAGVNMDDTTDVVGTAMDSIFFRADPRGFSPFGRRSEMLIPRSEGVRSEIEYNRAYDAVNSFMGDSADIVYFGPSIASDPQSSWVVIDDSGERSLIPYDAVSIAAQTGTLPQQ